MATWIMASDTSRQASRSRTSLRQHFIQPNVRWTIQNRGSTSNPVFLSVRRTIFGTKPLNAAFEHPGAIIRAVGEQAFEPQPTLAHGVEDRLRPGAVGDIRSGQVDH